VTPVAATDPGPAARSGGVGESESPRL